MLPSISTTAVVLFCSSCSVCVHGNCWVFERLLVVCVYNGCLSVSATCGCSSFFSSSSFVFCFFCTPSSPLPHSFHLPSFSDPPISSWLTPLSSWVLRPPFLHNHGRRRWEAEYGLCWGVDAALFHFFFFLVLYVKSPWIVYALVHRAIVFFFFFFF